MNKNFKSGSVNCCRSKSPSNTPIIKHPKIFAVNVANGKVVWRYLVTTTEVRYRKMLPSAPPSPTKIIALVIVILLSF